MNNELMEQVAEELSNADFDGRVFATWDIHEQKFSCDIENRKTGAIKSKYLSLKQVFNFVGDDWLSAEVKGKLK